MENKSRMELFLELLPILEKKLNEINYEIDWIELRQQIKIVLKTKDGGKIENANK